LAAPITLKEIPLAAVDLEDHAFVVPSSRDVERLTTSMAEVGLLAPPWLRARPDKRWQVVAGCKRLLAATQLGWERVPALILPPSAPDSHCLLVSLYDNAFTRGFNLWEMAFFATRLLNHWDRQTVVAKFLPYLGLTPSGAHLDRLVALFSLEGPLKELAARGRLALTAASALAGWDPEARAAVLPYLNALPLSQSKQEEFLEGLDLLARREGTTPREILSRPELEQYLVNKGPTPQERAEAVRRQLKRWVSPSFAAAQDAFGALLGRLGLKSHPRLRLQPPPAFEGPDFHLEVKFQDARELENLLKELTRLVQQEDFSRLTNL
jgi:ParB family chromosome partitioning protein